MRRIIGRSILCLALAAGAAPGQTKPAFEVATIKPSAPPDMSKIMSGQMPRIGAHIDGGRAEYLYSTLQGLMVAAYGVKPYQITGPGWITQQRFDVVAKLPEGAKKDDAPRMLQSLLEDRFGLTAHRATVERPVLGMVVGKGGPKLRKSSESPVPIDENTPLAPGEMTLDGHDGQIRMRIDSVRNSTSMNYGSKGTVTLDAPDTVTSPGYASNDLHAYSTSSPGPAAALMNCEISATDPAPRCTSAVPTPNRSASRSRSASAAPSG